MPDACKKSDGAFLRYAPIVTIMELNEFIDVESAKERFMGNENLYKRFLFELPNRTLYEELKEVLAQENVQEAFETAHRMKGIIENLSLNLLGRKIYEMVEVLRGGSLPDENLKDALDYAYTHSIQEILNIKENNIHIF